LVNISKKHKTRFVKKGLLLLSIVLGGLIALPSCAPKSQCKAYAKKKKKQRKSRYETITERDYLYEQRAF